MVNRCFNAVAVFLPVVSMNLEALQRLSGGIYGDKNLAEITLCIGQINPRQLGVAGIKLNFGWAQLSRCCRSLLPIETKISIGDQVTGIIPSPTSIDVFPVIDRAVKPPRGF